MLMKNLPKTIKIGPLSYKVRAVKDLKNNRNEFLYGNCDFNTGTINLDNECPPNRLAHVLLHEALHAMWIDRNFHKKKMAEFEEEMVSDLANVIQDFMQNNKELVKELCK